MMKKLVSGVFIVVGVIMLIVSIFIFMDCKEFKNVSEETTATVTKVNTRHETRSYRSNGRRRHRTVTVYDVSFDYEVNGKLFDGVIEFSNSKQIGEAFTVWYDKNDPDDVRSNNGSYALPCILAFMGALFAGVGCVTFKYQNRI